MINVNEYRVIDLSHKLIPSESKINGDYLHGRVLNDRPINVHEFKAWNARMHHIDGQTHTGTHIECPYKYDENGNDFGSIPLDFFMGEAVACNFEYKKKDEIVTPDDFSKFGIKAGDIVLVWGCSGKEEEQAYIANEAIDWLIGKRIKMFGCENIRHSPPGTPWGPGDTDYKLLRARIMFVDGLQGLNQIKKSRVFFIALPVRIVRVTAIWTRAIVFEDK